MPIPRPSHNVALCARPCHRIYQWRHTWFQLGPLPHEKVQHRLSYGRLQQRRYSSQNSQSPDIVFSDPNRPGLFYHFMNPPTPLSRTLPAYGLSFLHRTPQATGSPEVIGWLPAQTYASANSNVSDTNCQKREASLQDFRGNPEFLTLLHNVVRSGLAKGVDDVWKDTALQLGNGWMHIHDQRNPPDQGRIGDPDDIIGSVLVVDGQITAETYQPMPSYRVCTSDGVLQLTPGLAQFLQRGLMHL